MLIKAKKTTGKVTMRLNIFLAWVLSPPSLTGRERRVLFFSPFLDIKESNTVPPQFTLGKIKRHFYFCIRSSKKWLS